MNILLVLIFLSFIFLSDVFLSARECRERKRLFFRVLCALSRIIKIAKPQAASTKSSSLSPPVFIFLLSIFLL